MAFALARECRDNSGWFAIQTTDRLMFSNRNSVFPWFNASVFNTSTEVFDVNGVHACNGASGHCRNVQYVSPTSAGLASGTKHPDDSGQNDATLRLTFTDDVNFTMSNTEFWADDGVDVNNAPTGLIVVAYQASGFGFSWRNRVGGDTGGKAWDEAFGIGGKTNALNVTDNLTLNKTKIWYLYISVKPITRRGHPFRFVFGYDIS